MPVLFNFKDTDRIEQSAGFYIRSLINPDRVGSDCIALDRWEIDPNSEAGIEIAATDLAWFQLLEGEIELDDGKTKQTLNTDHVAFLPPAYEAHIKSAQGAVILFGRVPDAGRYDNDFNPDSLSFRLVNWKEEPALDSQHDNRKRIYLVTPTLFGTKSIKGEMIIYAPGTKASNHHHEGAEHFQYVISGTATALLSEEPHKIKAGDTLYNYEFERHNFINDDHEDLVFVEYFVPAECKTVWADDDPVCTWIPSGKNIEGGKASRDMAAHSSAETTNPEGV